MVCPVFQINKFERKRYDKTGGIKNVPFLFVDLSYSWTPYNSLLLCRRTWFIYKSLYMKYLLYLSPPILLL